MDGSRGQSHPAAHRAVDSASDGHRGQICFIGMNNASIVLLSALLFRSPFRVLSVSLSSCTSFPSPISSLLSTRYSTSEIRFNLLAVVGDRLEPLHMKQELLQAQLASLENVRDLRD